MGSRVLVTAVLCALAQAAAWAPGAAAAERIAWCGTDVQAADRPDTVTGHQIHVVYAVPADGTDRFVGVASAIASDFATIDAWWRRHDPTRAPRFDLAAFPCATELGRLDISSIRLPNAAAHYAPNATRFERLHADTFDGPYGFTHPSKKYVVLYDAPVEDPPEWCGVALRDENRGGRNGAAFVLIQAPGCRTRLGEGGRGSATMAHEILHMLGAMAPIGPPNACPADRIHPCDSEVDILRSGRREDFLDNLTLDVGRDDYYGHSGTWWDVQDSPWLRRPGSAVRLDVVLRGAGRVTTDLPGLDCTVSCGTTWDAGSRVTLAATPAEGWRFLRWEGACAGAAACTVQLDGPLSVTAVFWQPVRLTLGASRGGTVTSRDGLACPPACARDYDAGTAVTLRAVPAAGYRFAGWSGGCAGAEPTCEVTVGAATSVSAAFERSSFRLAAAKRGQGQVTGAGLRCGSRCAVTVAAGTRVRVRATPAKGWRFARWSGACRGTRACVVAMTADRRVTAVFTRRR